MADSVKKPVTILGGKITANKDFVAFCDNLEEIFIPADRLKSSVGIDTNKELKPEMFPFYGVITERESTPYAKDASGAKIKGTFISKPDGSLLTVKQRELKFLFKDRAQMVSAINSEFETTTDIAQSRLASLESKGLTTGLVLELANINL